MNLGKNHDEQTFWRRATASRLDAMTATTNILCCMIKDVVEVDGSRFRGPPSWSSTLIEIKNEHGKKSRRANFLASRHGVTTPRHDGHDQYFMLYDQRCSGGGWVSFPRAPILVQHFDRNKIWTWEKITTSKLSGVAPRRHDSTPWRPRPIFYAVWSRCSGGCKGVRFRGPPSWSSTLIEIKNEHGKKSRRANFLARLRRHDSTPWRPRPIFSCLWSKNVVEVDAARFRGPPSWSEHFDRNK